MTRMIQSFIRRGLVAGCVAALSPAMTVAAQSQVPPIQLPTVVVTAQKEPADVQTLPVSVTAVSRETLINAGVTAVREASIYAPNTQFSDFTARKLSNARFRGIGSSPANPGITTYFDGVPQLNSNTSNIDLMDVEQIEFVRGPQSALFGRNTLAGVVNVASARPSLTDWTSSVWVPVGNIGSREVRATASGPLAAGRAGVSGSLAYGRRDGYTRNGITGNDIDSREGFTGKGQLLWTPSSSWETRVIVTGERARDGDYALGDLAGLRRTPHQVTRDFEGHTDRDLLATTVLTRRAGGRVNLSTTTGFLRWKTADLTDLDYTPAPLLRRSNEEESFQFTQEVRVASAAAAPAASSTALPLRWQAGVFLFTQNYDQNAVNTLAPFLLSPFIPFQVSQTSPQAALDDFGFGLFGQVTTTLNTRLDLSMGARVDHESKDADLQTFLTPPIAPGRTLVTDGSFSNVSPQFSAAYRLQPERMVYASVGRGFKAGGFNAASPVGFEAYGEEHTWNIEGGVKTMWAAWTA
jgi:iron complex outermembrane receptor protein